MPEESGQQVPEIFRQIQAAERVTLEARVVPLRPQVMDEARRRDRSCLQTQARATPI
jgi:hypothetical protein